MGLSTSTKERPNKKRCLRSPLSNPLPSSTRRGGFVKCSKCHKSGRKSCSQKACIKCCTDMNCEGHREVREKENILNGTHLINNMANAKRALAAKHGAFRDPAFLYLGESIVIWNLRDYLSNTKWRDEAIRKSLRNIESRRQALMVEKEVLSRKEKKVLNRYEESSVNSLETSCKKDIMSNFKNKKENRKERFHRIMDELYDKIKESKEV